MSDIIKPEKFLYASRPRAVVKPKYKDVPSTITVPSNIMFDKRVVRGHANGKPVENLSSTSSNLANQLQKADPSKSSTLTKGY